MVGETSCLCYCRWGADFPSGNFQCWIRVLGIQKKRKKRSLVLGVVWKTSYGIFPFFTIVRRRQSTEVIFKMQSETWPVKCCLTFSDNNLMRKFVLPVSGVAQYKWRQSPGICLDKFYVFIQLNIDGTLKATGNSEHTLKLIFICLLYCLLYHPEELAQLHPDKLAHSR